MNPTSEALGYIIAQYMTDSKHSAYYKCPALAVLLKKVWTCAGHSSCVLSKSVTGLLTAADCIEVAHVIQFTGSSHCFVVHIAATLLCVSISNVSVCYAAAKATASGSFATASANAKAVATCVASLVDHKDNK